MFVNYGIFSFADINVRSFTAIRPSSVYFFYVTRLYKLIDGSFYRRNTTLGIFSYPPVRRIAVFILALPVAQVSVDALRCEGQVISEYHLVTFHQ